MGEAQSEHVRYEDGRVHTLPAAVGEPGVLAALLRAVAACFAPADEVSLTTPYGDTFEALVEARAVRQGGWGRRYYTLAAGDPAVVALADALDAAQARGERAGVVYLGVARGDEELLQCEQTYDWLWIRRTLPESLDARVLDEVARHLSSARG